MKNGREVSLFNQISADIKSVCDLHQEETSLRNIDDSFKKIIVIGEETPVIRTTSGTTIISIYDFLLKENSLEL